MKIKTEINMDGFEFLGRFYDHYIEEKDFAGDYIKYHTLDNGHWDDELERIVLDGASVKLNDFRFAFEKYADEKRKINNQYPENLVAFALTMDYFGIKEIEITY